MDMHLINQVLAGDVGVDELSVPERMAVMQMVIAAEVKPAPKPLPKRFVLPPAIEAMYRGRPI